MQNITPTSNLHTSFEYHDRQVIFRSENDEDHILNVMRRKNTFYEHDVLECLRERFELRKSHGSALDIGAYIGTHSVYFSLFCGCKPVYAYEVNPETFNILQHNIRQNRLDDSVFPINMALSSAPGRSNIIQGPKHNQGATSIDFSTDGDVQVSTIDEQVKAHSISMSEIALIKIDVEGAELEVLSGATNTLNTYKPILCVEIHTKQNLRALLRLLRIQQYWIIDCLGYSPTYIIEPSTRSPLRRFMVNYLWLLRASNKSSRMRWYLQRIAQILRER